MKNRSIIVMGAFGYENNQLDGQTIKTRNVFNMLEKRYDGLVRKMDTQAIKRQPWLFFLFIWYLATCKSLILLPCLNSLSYLFPIAFYLSKLFRYDVVSICIGGWQVEYFIGNKRFAAHPLQMKLSKKVKAFLPELEKVNRDLIELLEFKNTEVLPNFRRFDIFDCPTELHDGLRIVFMARINKKKGFEEAIESVKILKRQGEDVTLDFYGQIADEDRKLFQSLLDKNKDMVKYRGPLEPQDIYQTLSKYDVLLLPTQYYTEGFPGSILDAYIAGIPVIATEWKHSHEFIDDGKTGFIVPFGDCIDAIVDNIKILCHNHEKLAELKTNAHNESQKYSEDKAWDVLNKYL